MLIEKLLQWPCAYVILMSKVVEILCVCVYNDALFGPLIFSGLIFAQKYLVCMLWGVLFFFQSHFRKTSFFKVPTPLGLLGALKFEMGSELLQVQNFCSF